MMVNGYDVKPRADLRSANLQGADLRRADLQDANLQGANLQRADLQDANLRNANLQGADLRSANLLVANLQGANLQGADLDSSCWPLWCGTQGVRLDDSQIDQLCLHLVWVWAKAPTLVHVRAKRAAKKRNVGV